VVRFDCFLWRAFAERRKHFNYMSGALAAEHKLVSLVFLKKDLLV
jgi:hypothetical protein